MALCEFTSVNCTPRTREASLRDLPPRPLFSSATVVFGAFYSQGTHESESKNAQV